MAYACEFPYFTVGGGCLVVASINGERHYLLLKRKAHLQHASKWGVPGGYAKGADAENPAACARRETVEELGESLAAAAAQVTPYNTAFLRPNMEKNSLFAKHPDARENQANLHCLWVVNVDEAIARSAVNADPSEHSDVGLHAESAILANPAAYAPWLADTIRTLVSVGKL